MRVAGRAGGRIGRSLAQDQRSHRPGDLGLRQPLDRVELPEQLARFRARLDHLLDERPPEHLGRRRRELGLAHARFPPHQQGPASPQRRANRQRAFRLELVILLGQARPVGQLHRRAAIDLRRGHPLAAGFALAHGVFHFRSESRWVCRKPSKPPSTMSAAGSV